MRICCLSKIVCKNEKIIEVYLSASVQIKCRILAPKRIGELEEIIKISKEFAVKSNLLNKGLSNIIKDIEKMLNIIYEI